MNKDPASELSELIEADSRKEHECRALLNHVPQLLFGETVIEAQEPEKEYRGHSGDSDYIVYGRVADESGYECKRAYIWETKAPQCFIFEKDDSRTRLRPTEELIKAETQLLYYHYENSQSTLFYEQFGITSQADVRIGGIIIGCHKTRVSGVSSASQTEALYKRAVRIRNEYFYKNSIRLLTWDEVLRHLRPPDVINNRNVPGDPSTIIEASGHSRE